MEKHCSCGNKFMVLLNVLDTDATIVAQPNEPPTAWCPACSAVWQFGAAEGWHKVVGVSSLQALRHLSVAS